MRSAFEEMQFAVGLAKERSRQSRVDRAACRPSLFLFCRASRHSWMNLARAFKAIHLREQEGVKS